MGYYVENLKNLLKPVYGKLEINWGENQDQEVRNIVNHLGKATIWTWRIFREYLVNLFFS